MVAAGAEPADGVQITAIDQEFGARLATRHLLELGHTRIGHIAGPEPMVRRHRTGAGLARRTGRSRRSARPIGGRRLDRGQRAPAIGQHGCAGRRLPSAVFVANDLMALGFIRAMHDAGVRVPEDISIVGFDDMPGAGHLIPGLTTVRQDLDGLGRQCIAMLLAALNGSAGRFAPLEPTLVVRESAARFAG